MSGKTPLFTTLQRRSRVSFLFSSGFVRHRCFIRRGWIVAPANRATGGRVGKEREEARKQRKDSRKFHRRFVLWYASPRSLNAGIFFKTSFFPRLIPSVIIADPCSEFQWNKLMEMARIEMLRYYYRKFFFFFLRSISDKLQRFERFHKNFISLDQ